MSPAVYGRDNETRSPLAVRGEGRTVLTTSPSVPIIIGATVAVIVVLVAIIVGILIAWKYSIRQRKKREVVERSATQEGKNDVFAAQPPKPILRPCVPPAESGVTWVPQVRTVVDIDKNTAALNYHKKERDITDQFDESESARAKACPPPYSTTNLRSSGTLQEAPEPSPSPTRQPSPQPVRNRFSMSSSPMAAEPVEVVLSSQTERHPGSPLPPTPATPCLTVEFSISSAPSESVSTFPPTPSPRSASFRDILPPSKQSHALKGSTTQSMTVIQTFSPGRDDELPIKVGETLLLVYEYKDGWCLVQRTDGPHASKGVIPRFCIQGVTDVKSATLLQVPNI